MSVLNWVRGSAVFEAHQLQREAPKRWTFTGTWARAKDRAVAAEADAASYWERMWWTSPCP